MSREEKRSKFVEEKKSKTGLYFLNGVLVMALSTGGIFYGTRSLRDLGLINVGAVDYRDRMWILTKLQLKKATEI